MSYNIEKLTFELYINTTEFQKLLGLCLEQTTLINELHEQVYDNPVLDAKVEVMFENIRAMQLDSYLNKIKADAILYAVEMTEKLDKYDDLFCDPEDLEDYAIKLIRGEV